MRTCLKLILTTIVLLSYGNVYTQSTDYQRLADLKNVIPPSPNSSSLGEYADWPVHEYTGVPSISIPIYEVKSSSISMPISLSYHAGGIKVGDIASWAGLAWTLNAGGVITRSVRGLPDEYSPGGYLLLRQNYNDPGNFNSTTTPPTFIEQHYTNAAKGELDSEPDVYSFSAMGKSYKLFFKGDGTIVTMPFSNIKFTVNFATKTWVVILEDGTKLVFGGSNSFVDYVTNPRFGSVVPVDPFVNTWHLQTVTGINGDQITFSYTSPANIQQDNYFFETDYAPNSRVGSSVDTASVLAWPLEDGYKAGGCACVVANRNKGTSKKSEKQQVSTLLLNSIESDLVIVYFYTDTNPRSDLEGGKRLSAIKVFSKLSNTFINQYTFYHHYQAAAGGTEYNSLNETYFRFRLKLDSLAFQGINNTSYQVWKFDYNTLSLPSRRSYAQDHWGFYNGQSSNNSLLPRMYLAPPQYLVGFNPFTNPAGKRHSNPEYMQAEILNKITYPTGGFSAFTFEPNAIPATEEWQKDTIKTSLLNITGGPGNPVTIKLDTITITQPQIVKLDFTATFSASLLADYPQIQSHLKIRKIDRTAEAGLAVIAAINGVQQTGYAFLTQPGQYEIKLTCSGTQSEFHSASETAILNASVQYAKSLGVFSFNKPVGGLRIKTITDYDPYDAAKAIRKDYTYSGPLLIAPIDTINSYLNDYTQEFDASSCGGFCFQDYVVRSSSTKAAFGSIEGGTVGYSRVSVQYSNGASGKTVFSFSNENDNGAFGATLFPYPPAESYEWRRGQLLSRIDYDATGKPVKKLLNTFQYSPKAQLTIFKAGFSTYYLQPSFQLNGVTWPKFYISTEQVKQVTTTQTTYSYPGNDSLVQTTNFYYDNANNLSPVRTETSDSKGNILKTIQRTALEKTDINSATPLTSTASVAIDTMIARNMISQVIQQEQYRGSNLMNRSLTNYKNWTSALLAPENLQLQTSTNPIETRLLFAKYDSKGNLLEQQKAYDAKNTYLYDYAQNLPIAEAINADNLSIAHTSFEADGGGNWTLPDTIRNYTYSITGRKSYSLVTGKTISATVPAGKQYIVSYWSRNGAITIKSNGATIALNFTGLVKNGFTYYEHILPNTTTAVTATASNAVIDELRLYPIDAQMKTYTYNPLIGMTSSCDVSNTITYYEYDAFNRLKFIRDRDRNIIKTITYQYKSQVGN